MKRNLLVLMISTLLALAIMTACSPAAKTSTAVPSNATAPTAYPAKQEPTPQTAAVRCV
jgi:ABC-type oligopeptide transport system substrate-binding subunit